MRATFRIALAACAIVAGTAGLASANGYSQNGYYDGGYQRREYAPRFYGHDRGYERGYESHRWQRAQWEYAPRWEYGPRWIEGHWAPYRGTMTWVPAHWE